MRKPFVYGLGALACLMVPVLGARTRGTTPRSAPLAKPAPELRPSRPRPLAETPVAAADDILQAGLAKPNDQGVMFQGVTALRQMHTPEARKALDTLEKKALLSRIAETLLNIPGWHPEEPYPVAEALADPTEPTMSESPDQDSAPKTTRRPTNETKPPAPVPGSRGPPAPRDPGHRPAADLLQGLAGPTGEDLGRVLQAVQAPVHPGVRVLPAFPALPCASSRQPYAGGTLRWTLGACLGLEQFPK